MCEHLNVKIDSAGILAHYLGYNPYPSSKHNALIHNISIEKKRASQINKADLDRFDLIYAKDRENLKNILKLAESDLQRKSINLIENCLNTKNIDVLDSNFSYRMSLKRSI
tara:strand:+ start:30 stop:362 length:333 start_codon:yes stop_codon:yes gene_type:complete